MCGDSSSTQARQQLVDPGGDGLGAAARRASVVGQSLDPRSLVVSLAGQSRSSPIFRVVAATSMVTIRGTNCLETSRMTACKWPEESSTASR